MNHKNNVVKKRDLERYEIILPFSAMAGKRKKQFLCSELEKLHPCFSDEFAFDSVFRKISRKGLCEDVFVMNKYKLAEYEGRRRFSGSGFFVENDSKDKAGNQNRFCRIFIAGKCNLSIFAIYGCFIMCIAGIAGGVLAGNSNVVSVEATSEITAMDTKGEIPVQSGMESENNLVSSFMRAVSEANGKIDLFEWSLEQGKERLAVSVKGVLPENLPENFINGSENILYENGIPQMKLISVKNPVPRESTPSLIPNADFYKKLREILKSAGAELKEEKAPPYHIEFICKKKSENKKTEIDSVNGWNESCMLFQELAKIINEEGRALSSVAIKSLNSEELKVGLSIEKLFFEGFDLRTVAENLELFESNPKPSERKKIADGIQTVKAEKDEPEKQLVKIGEIKRPGNAAIVFYKNPDGKILKVSKEGK